MKYELTFLLNEEKELAVLRDLLKSLNVTLTKENAWGKKALCYPINKQIQAAFYHWEIIVDRKVVGELRKRLNYNENLIRYLLLAI